jgi:hypothetical protein
VTKLPGAATSFFQWVALVGFVLTFARLTRSGLVRRYRYFSAYLIYCTIPYGTSLLLDVRSAWYFKIWVFTQPLLWIFNFVVVLELYSLVLEKYKGLYTLGRWALWASMGISVVLSSVTLIPQLGNQVFKSSQVFLYYMVVERGVICSLLLFLFLILLLLRQYPVRLSRNVIVHCVVYSIFFLTSTMVQLLYSVFAVRTSNQVNMVVTGVMALCVLLWFSLLSAKGETVLVTVSSLGVDHERRILEKLDSLNSTVLRAARK